MALSDYGELPDGVTIDEGAEVDWVCLDGDPLGTVRPWTYVSGDPPPVFSPADGYWPPAFGACWTTPRDKTLENGPHETKRGALFALLAEATRPYPNHSEVR